MVIESIASWSVASEIPESVKARDPARSLTGQELTQEFHWLSRDDLDRSRGDSTTVSHSISLFATRVANREHFGHGSRSAFIQFSGRNNVARNREEVPK